MSCDEDSKCETIQPYRRLILMVQFFTFSKTVTTFFNFKLSLSVGDVKVKSCIMKRNSLNYAYYSACRIYYNQSCDVWHVSSFLFCILKNFIEYICLIYSTMMWKHVGCLELKNYKLFCRKCIITL
jgi:hypothetical protein